ncbi:hypothetical protein [Aeromicrobium stalagmiti]|uniref:hypothetical protein n=1 Tax=Aeromicrobium stalagmiti TaxID=2738988 RepID=UPI001569DFEA|nr:hypothetical protein [Aeromicrobium stalagmiti]NRQ48594.1 hypothetical protein [Aeromicrobium stalagmiti]
MSGRSAVSSAARRVVARWPGVAARRRRIAVLEASVRATRTTVEAVRDERDAIEKAVGLEPSLLDLEWVEHRAALQHGASTPEDDAELARSCGLVIVPGPGDIEVMAFYGQVGALVEPREGGRPVVMLMDPGGWLKPTSTGYIEHLPADLDTFLAGVAALSLRRSAVHLRVEALRSGDSIGFVRIVPPTVQPEPRFTRNVDRLLGLRAERARVRRRHDLARPAAGDP